MGTGCSDKVGDWMFAADRQYYDGPKDFGGAAVSVGDSGIWIDVKTEIERSRGEAAGKGACRQWDSKNWPFRDGVLCTLPLG